MLNPGESKLESLLERVELVRREASTALDQDRRSELGQFLTPRPIARFMASMFSNRPSAVRLLEAGAGVGSLVTAFTAAACHWDRRPASISVVAYELDNVLAGHLHTTLQGCRAACRDADVAFTSEIRNEDFIGAATRLLGDLFASSREQYNCAILNPPYRKINSDSRARRQLRSVGIETSNLYTAFLGLTVQLLEPGGEMVAITPRSFCNGPYFRPFRDMFLNAMSLQRVHVFESRDHAFRDDEVLQENIIVHAIKRVPRRKVFISSSQGPDGPRSERLVDYSELVSPDDSEKFIHIVPDETGRVVAETIRAFRSSLTDVGIEVSTGRVVEFRAKQYVLKDAVPESAPLIYPGHFVENFIAWPRTNYKKPNALAVAPATLDLMLPRGVYVVVKRFTSKEERRRVVAAIFDPSRVPGDRVGFENHLNVFHSGNAGLPMDLAKGLAVYLNSTVVDSYFRQFNGHTQVNATDLRNMRYPSREALVRLGQTVDRRFPEQEQVDSLLADLMAQSERRQRRA